MITIEDLWLYPVKSLRGFRVKASTLTPLGFLWDRHWMLIDEQGKFLTQRKIPAMVLIRTQLNNTHLILSKGGIDDYHLPLNYPRENTTREASIWKDSCNVIFEEASVNAWLQQALNIELPVFMVRMKKDTRRSQAKANLLGKETHTLFADAAPFLISNSASLDIVNQALTQKSMDTVSIEQFRPNIVIKGIEAFEEHNIQQLNHADYTFKHCYPCQRCVMTTINLDSAQAHPKQEPFISLMSINTMPDNAKAPAFGENAILTKGEGKQIQLGDTLTL